MEIFKYEYQTPKSLGSLGGVERLRKSTRALRKDVKEYLQGDEVYSLYKPARRRFPRDAFRADSINSLWQGDLMDMQKYAKWNDGYRYLLILRDSFSKYTQAIPVRNKYPKDVVEAFKKAVVVRDFPLTLYVDQGTEFKGEFAKYLRKHGVNLVTSTDSAIKAAEAERFIRTLRDRFARLFEVTNQQVWLDHLSDIMYSYNHTTSRRHGFAPADVTMDNAGRVWKRLYPKGYGTVALRRPHFKIGDVVRIAIKKHLMEKSSTQTFTSEEFKIVKRSVRSGLHMYKLHDANDKPIVGRFYEQELQKIKPQEVYKVERTLGERVRNGQREYLIVWKGFPEPSWVPASQFEAL